MQKRLKKLDKILKYLVAAIVLVIPLYPKFPFISIPGTHVAIRLEDFIIAFSGILLVYIIAPDLKKFLRDKLNISIFLYLAVGLISLLSALFVTKTVSPQLGFLHWVRRVEYFIPFFIGYYAIKSNNKNLEFIVKVMMITIVVAFLYGLGQRYLNWPIIVTQNVEHARGIALRYIPGSHINSTFAGHYDLGTFLVLLLPVFLSLFFLQTKKRTKFILFIIISACLWLLAYSGSRISTVSYMISAAVALIFIRKIKAIPLILVYSLLIFSMSPNLVARYSRIFQVTIDKVKSINLLNYYTEGKEVFAAEESSGLPTRRVLPTATPTPQPVFEDRSTSIRLNIEWPRAIRALTKNPLLGTGYSSITLATDNDFLRLLGEVGIVGFLAFFLIFSRLGRIFISAFPLIKKFKGIELAFVSGIIASLVGVFINAVFIDIFEASKFAIIFWLMIGLLVSTIKSKKYG